MPFQDGTYNKLLAQEKKSIFCKQGGKQDYSSYSQVTLLPTQASRVIYSHIYNVCMKKKCNLTNWEGSNLPQVVATDFFLKLCNTSASRNTDDSA